MRVTEDLYWQALGIPVWKLRAQPKPHSYLVLNSKQEVIATLVTELNSTAEQELLTNIMQALLASLKLISEDQLSASYSHLPCFIFGTQLQHKLMALNLSESFVFCSLEAMLQDPSRKKEVWQKLRVFKSNQ